MGSLDSNDCEGPSWQLPHDVASGSGLEEEQQDTFPLCQPPNPVDKVGLDDECWTLYVTRKSFPALLIPTPV
jgi:hypothetical protein